AQRNQLLAPADGGLDAFQALEVAVDEVPGDGRPLGDQMTELDRRQAKEATRPERLRGRAVADRRARECLQTAPMGARPRYGRDRNALTADVPLQLHLAGQQDKQVLRRLPFDEHRLAGVEAYLAAQVGQPLKLLGCQALEEERGAKLVGEHHW